MQSSNTDQEGHYWSFMTLPWLAAPALYKFSDTHYASEVAGTSVRD